jgi:glycosyltransferase involved in cell wall biosynthesis
MSLKVDGSGTNPLKDAKYFVSLLRIYRSIRPNIVHHFSIKPVIYGSLAAKLCPSINVVNTITGLGISYGAKNDLISVLVRNLYRLAIAGKSFTVFQNEADRTQFVRDGIVTVERSALVPGSGIDTTTLTPDYMINHTERTTFVMVSRMLWRKGVNDFVEAARQVKQLYPQARFLMFGGSKEDYGSKNPDFIPRNWLDDLNREGIVEWRGWTPPEAVEQWMRRCAAVVHPSYYPEGVPRTLIEAAAAGAPIITTDMPGCRDAVIDKVSGRICPVQSPDALAAAMIELLQDPKLIGRQGREGRCLAEKKFTRDIVLGQILQIYDSIQHE